MGTYNISNHYITCAWNLAAIINVKNLNRDFYFEDLGQAIINRRTFQFNIQIPSSETESDNIKIQEVIQNMTSLC